MLTTQGLRERLKSVITNTTRGKKGKRDQGNLKWTRRGPVSSSR